MGHPETYELIFQAAAVDDVVLVRRTLHAGAGGSPIYEDDTGIVRAEISERGEVRMLASGGHQAHQLPVTARAAPVREAAGLTSRLSDRPRGDG
ncbi:DUF6296 family protein [Streptomyces sp. NPDC003023]|uniref:DUF6296 family protein n=1 Tax=Streptomyces sp. NPDC003023 TaxID=3364675 RepID=UPI0036B908D6